MPLQKSTYFDNGNQILNRLINAALIFMAVFTLFWFVIHPEQKLRLYSPLFNQALISFLLLYINLTLTISIIISLTLSLPITQILKMKLRGLSTFLFTSLQMLMFDMSTLLGWFILGVVSIALSFYFTLFGLKQHKLSLKHTSLIVITIYFFAGLSHAVRLFLNSNQDSYQFFHLLNTIHLILIIPITIITCYLSKKTETLALLYDSRFLRILHYELMLCLGMALAIRSLSTHNFNLIPSAQLISDIILCMISLVFAGFFSIIFNNLYDVDIDKISNPNRPLVTQSISSSNYVRLGVMFFVLSILYATMVDYKATLLISASLAGYWIYSVPPYRIKRIPVFSKIVLSINSILMIVLGYFLITNEVSSIPKMIYFIYLVCFTLAANLIDLKDIAGDRLFHIHTLPILIGEKHAKTIIGIGAFLNCIAFYMLTKTAASLIVFAVAGFTLYYLINKKQYDERIVLTTMTIYMSLLISYLCISAALPVDFLATML